MKTLPESWESRVPRLKRRKSAGQDSDAVLELVREGVRRFILKDAPLGDFQRAVRAAAGRGEGSTHPLTGVAFRKIVKQAIRERKRRTGRE